MLKNLLSVSLILTLWLSGSWAQAARSLQLDVDPNGKVSVIVSVELSPQHVADNKSTFGSASTWYLIIPFGLGPNALISGPSDLTVSVLKNSDDYAIMGILAPSAVRAFTLRIQHVPALRLTSEGKARISLDVSFRFMSQAEKEILNASYVISDFDFTVAFPTRYQDDQVVFRPFEFQREDLGKRYRLPVAAYAKSRLQQNAESIWIVFPNPIKTSIDSYKIILSMLSGFAAIGFSLRTINKDNRYKWYGAGGLSFCVLLILLYFYHASPQGIDLVVWAGALVPPSLYAMGAGCYLAIAKRYQATVRGQVWIGGRPAKYATVSLQRKEGDQLRVVAHIDSLGPSGEYEFDSWIKGTPSTFIVTAKYYMSDRNRDEKASEPTTVGPGQTANIPTLELAAPVTEGALV